jgi:hypothetical protein
MPLMKHLGRSKLLQKDEGRSVVLPDLSLTAYLSTFFELPSSSISSSYLYKQPHNMSQNQREAWERVQLMLQRRKGGFGGIPGGGRGGGMGLAGLILLGVGGWAVSNSLFNGTLSMRWYAEYLNLIPLSS